MERPAERRPAWIPSAPGAVATWVFAAVAAVSALGAFAGLTTSGWWTDELFTLFVVDHHGGPAEVLRRSLTDTQPPGYYLLLHGWSRIVGVGEAGLRSLSAILAVAAVAVFLWSVRRTVSIGARAWAAAVATTSPAWFVQSQNIRNYSLCFLLFAVMLALALRLRREVRAGRPWPWVSWAALTVAGAADAAAHFYGLLGFGALLAALIVSLPSWRLRVALAASGLAVAAGEAAYIHLLVGHTHENFQHLWFTRSPFKLLAVVYDAWRLGVGGAARLAVAALALAWAAAALARRGRAASADVLPAAGMAEGEAAWLAGVCVFVLVAVYAAGFAVSLLFAPSLSDRNVLTAAPAVWTLVAILYDAALRRLDPRAGAALALAAAALLVFHAVAIGRGRGLERNEPWRETAAYVSALPACRGAVLDGVQPDKFGPDTPFYRMIARRWLFGRYLGDRWPQVVTHLRGAFTDAGGDSELAARLAQRARDPASCPVLAWAVHDVDTKQAYALRDGMAARLGLPPGALRLHTFPDAHFKGDRWSKRPAGYLFERAAAAPPHP